MNIKQKTLILSVQLLMVTASNRIHGGENNNPAPTTDPQTKPIMTHIIPVDQETEDLKISYNKLLDSSNTVLWGGINSNSINSFWTNSLRPYIHNKQNRIDNLEQENATLKKEVANSFTTPTPNLIITEKPAFSFIFNNKISYWTFGFSAVIGATYTTYTLAMWLWNKLYKNDSDINKFADDRDIIEDDYIS
jgi:hypothetical protein